MAFGESRTGNACPLGVHTMSNRADYLDRGFTPHLLDISKQGLRAKFMRPIFPVRTMPQPCYEILTFVPDVDIPVSSLNPTRFRASDTLYDGSNHWALMCVSAV